MIYEIAILILSIPAGLLISWLARDELIAGKKWFKILVIAGVSGIIGGWLFGFSEIAWTSGFVIIVSMVSYLGSNVYN